eukprot:1601791-Pyramimonas_sp.AAC.1
MGTGVPVQSMPSSSPGRARPPRGLHAPPRAGRLAHRALGGRTPRRVARAAAERAAPHAHVDAPA